MKKVIYLFFILVFVATLSSCTTDIDDTIQVKLVQKIIEVNQDNTSSTFNFTYDGNKISSIESGESLKSYQYTGNFITQITEVNKITLTQSTLDYSYTDGLLTKVISSDNYTLNYTHQTNGSIDLEKTTTDSNNNIVLVWNGKLVLNTNYNVIENNKTQETSNPNTITKEELNFVYDTKSNPLRNIVGFDKLLDHSNMISKNNVTSIFKTNSTTFVDLGSYISSLVQTTKNYSYDKEGYPKEVFSTKPVFGNENQNHLKTLYFY